MPTETREPMWADVWAALEPLIIRLALRSIAKAQTMEPPAVGVVPAEPPTAPVAPLPPPEAPPATEPPAEAPGEGAVNTGEPETTVAMATPPRRARR
jgi:hypothetical protein